MSCGEKMPFGVIEETGLYATGSIKVQNFLFTTTKLYHDCLSHSVYISRFPTTFLPASRSVFTSSSNCILRQPNIPRNRFIHHKSSSAFVTYGWSSPVSHTFVLQFRQLAFIKIHVSVSFFSFNVSRSLNIVVFISFCFK